jgi:hypothetical protein
VDVKRDALQVMDFEKPHGAPFLRRIKAMASGSDDNLTLKANVEASDARSEAAPPCRCVQG